MSTPSTLPTDSAKDTTKTLVREKYGEIVDSGESCSGDACGCGSDLSMIGDAYDDIEGYIADADLGLGCGLPTEHAALQEGETVLDLGSGAGLDAFVARRFVGESGRVIGLDMTPEMLEKARTNAASLGYDNVEFIEGDIEAIPLPDNHVDVILSNCVLNLAPDKKAAFAEMLRVLRPGGRFIVSDIVTRGTLPESVRRSAELYVGCVAGAIEESDYLGLLEATGFEGVRVATDKVIPIPDEALPEEASKEDRVTLQSGETAVVSVTVVGTTSENR